jgi:hypothetical protein
MSDSLSDSAGVRWLRRSAVGCGSILGILVVSLLMLRGCLIRIGSRQMAEFEQASDQKDPGWRWDDILQQRAEVAEPENSAPRILAAAKLLPKGWPQAAAVARDDKHPNLRDPLVARIRRTQPNHRLGDGLAADLRAELKPLAPALVEARPVAELQRGRYEITWTRDLLTTPLPHAEKIRSVADLLVLDSALRLQDRDFAGSLHSIRALINTGRSLGDEPLLISQLLHIAVVVRGIEALERVLAQAPPVQEQGVGLSTLLQTESEESEKLLLKTMRAERAAMARILELTANGELDLSQLEGGRGDTAEKMLSWPILQPLARYGEAPTLELMTRYLESLSLPPAERRAALDKFDRELRQLKADHHKHLDLLPAMLLMPAMTRVVAAFDHEQAVLRCAGVALAAERYRQAHNAWPESFAQLVPEQLAKIPEDPFGAGPLRYRRLAEGVVIYSVGQDGKDNNGEINWENWAKTGADVGFRLWNPDKRGLPQKAEPPPDD